MGKWDMRKLKGLKLFNPEIGILWKYLYIYPREIKDNFFNISKNTFVTIGAQNNDNTLSSLYKPWNKEGPIDDEWNTVVKAWDDQNNSQNSPHCPQHSTSVQSKRSESMSSFQI